MKKSGRFSAFLSACLTAILLLGGCSGTQSGEIILYDHDKGSQADVEVSLFGYKADALNLVAIENTLRDFMDQNPGVTVLYEGLKGSQYWKAFDKRAQTDNLDDLFMVDHDHVLDLGGQGRLADLSDVPDLENFSLRARNQFTNKDGSVYFLPTCLSAFGLYINYDLLERHGQKVPENWAEFQEVCDYFVSQGIVPIVINSTSALRSLIVARSMYPYYQVEDTNAQMDAFNSGQEDLAEALRPGIDMAADMVSRGWFDCEEALVTSQTSGDLELFAKGDRPFMVTGAWASPRVKDMESGFSYGIHAFPVLDDGSVLVIDVNTCVAVNAESPHVKEAKELVAYMIQPNVIWEYCDSQSSYTPLQDDRTPSDETIAPCAEYLTNGRTVIGSDYRLEAPVDSSLYSCVTLLLEGGTEEEAMELLARSLAA